MPAAKSADGAFSRAVVLEVPKLLKSINCFSSAGPLRSGVLALVGAGWLRKETLIALSGTAGVALAPRAAINNMKKQRNEVFVMADSTNRNTLICR